MIECPSFCLLPFIGVFPYPSQIRKAPPGGAGHSLVNTVFLLFFLGAQGVSASGIFFYFPSPRRVPCSILVQKSRRKKAGAARLRGPR